MITLYAKQKKRHRCIEQSFRLWEKARVGCFKRTALKHVYYLGWNRSPAQGRCMRQALGPGARGRPRGVGWRGRWEGGSGWGTHVNPWLLSMYDKIHYNKKRRVWQRSRCGKCMTCSLRLIEMTDHELFTYEELPLKWEGWLGPDCRKQSIQSYTEDYSTFYKVGVYRESLSLGWAYKEKQLTK